MFDALDLAAIAGTFLLGGTVKGTVGFGLPVVSLALLTVAFGLPQAMALMLVPAFVTNLWQAAVGGNGGALLRRLWPFLLLAAATVWLGTLALSRADLSWLSALLGLLLVTYASISLAGLRFTVTPQQESWAGPLVGAINGVLSGMTGAYVVPGALYLQALGLQRDQLVQAMGMLFLVSTLSLAAALGGNGFLNAELGSISAAGIVPALIGMLLGQFIRRRLSEQLFRRVFFAALLLLGAYIVLRAFAG